jgi:hypothetical protein
LDSFCPSDLATIVANMNTEYCLLVGYPLRERRLRGLKNLTVSGPFLAQKMRFKFDGPLNHSRLQKFAREAGRFFKIIARSFPEFHPINSY